MTNDVDALFTDLLNHLGFSVFFFIL